MSHPQEWKAAVTNMEEAWSVLDRAAHLNALELSVDSRWQPSDSWANTFGTWNPAKGIYNTLRYGQWSNEMGAFEVGLDRSRYQGLYGMFLEDARKAFYRHAHQGWDHLLNYLEGKKLSAIRSWENVQDRFVRARAVNDMVRQDLNAGIDRCFRIRTGASLAFCIVGSLPAGGVAALGLAASHWGWVALAGGIYGAATTIIWNPSQRNEAKVLGYDIQTPMKEGIIGAGGNAAQAALEYKFQQEAQQACHRAAARYLGTSMSPLAADYLRTVQQQGANRTSQNLAQTRALGGKLIGGAFIAVGIWMMKDDLWTALKGYTAEDQKRAQRQ
jgi:hypothetical protein